MGIPKASSHPKTSPVSATVSVTLLPGAYELYLPADDVTIW